MLRAATSFAHFQLLDIKKDVPRRIKMGKSLVFQLKANTMGLFWQVGNLEGIDVHQ